MVFEKLGEFISISKGKKHLISESPSGISKRLIQIGDLRNDNNIKYTEDNKGVQVTEDDLIIAWDGANAGTIGYGKVGYIGSTLARLRKKSADDFDTVFLGKFLQSKFDYLRKTATGAAIPHISRKALNSIKIPLFHLQDQARIATILSKAEALIAKRKECSHLLDKLLKSTFMNMFGDVQYNYKDFEIGVIGDLTTEVKYGTSRPAKGGKFPYLRMNNITYEGYWDFSKLKYIDIADTEKEKYLVRKGDLVFNRTNSKELVGKTAVYNKDDEMIIAGYLIRVRVKDGVSPWFVWGYLNSHYGKSRLFNLCRNIVGMANINATELQKIKILKPPKGLQRKFAKIVEKVETIKFKNDASLSELLNLYGSLSERAFRGELDLSKVPLEQKADIKSVIPKFEDNFNDDEMIKESRSDEDLISIIKRMAGQTMTSTELYKKVDDELDIRLEGEYSYVPLDYDRFKNVVFSLLEGDKPVLSQEFDPDEIKREVILRVNE